MILEMNTRDFYKVKNGYENALELYDQSLFKEARLELRLALKILERTPVRTPFHHKCYLLFAQICEALEDPEKADHYRKLAADYLNCSSGSTKSGV